MGPDRVKLGNPRKRRRFVVSESVDVGYREILVVVFWGGGVVLGSETEKALIFEADGSNGASSFRFSLPTMGSS